MKREVSPRSIKAGAKALVVEPGETSLQEEALVLIMEAPKAGAVVETLANLKLAGEINLELQEVLELELITKKEKLRPRQVVDLVALEALEVVGLVPTLPPVRLVDLEVL